MVKETEEELPKCEETHNSWRGQRQPGGEQREGLKNSHWMSATRVTSHDPPFTRNQESAKSCPLPKRAKLMDTAGQSWALRLTPLADLAHPLLSWDLLSTVPTRYPNSFHRWFLHTFIFKHQYALFKGCRRSWSQHYNTCSVGWMVEVDEGLQQDQRIKETRAKEGVTVCVRCVLNSFDWEREKTRG